MLQKMPSFFFRELQLNLIFKFLYKLKQKVYQLCMGFSIFDSVSFLSKFTFLLKKKSVDSLTLKGHNSFQNKNNWKVTHSFKR